MAFDVLQLQKISNLATFFYLFRWKKFEIDRKNLVSHKNFQVLSFFMCANIPENFIMKSYTQLGLTAIFLPNSLLFLPRFKKEAASSPFKAN